MLLAIETSCDESAVALYDSEAFLTRRSFSPEFLRWERVSSQAHLHEAYGGVVPELAAREHQRNLPMLLRECLRETGADIGDLTSIAVTQGPGLKGSLLVGIAAAKALSFARRIPLIPVNHLEGHLWAGEMNESGVALALPALALIVSGGHTLLVQVDGMNRYRTIAKTRDDAAGEAFDKVASMLGLPYPGGPALSRCAVGGDPARFRLPVGVADDPHSFSFSGLKTAVCRLIASFPAPLAEEVRRDIASSVEFTICQTLVSKTVETVENTKPQSVVLTGGVAANRTLRRLLVEQLGDIPCLIPPVRWCTDNAAMIGLVALKLLADRKETYGEWKSSEELGPGAPFNLGALPRFPVDLCQ